MPEPLQQVHAEHRGQVIRYGGENIIAAVTRYQVLKVVSHPVPVPGGQRIIKRNNGHEHSCILHLFYADTSPHAPPAGSAAAVR
ncbi:hypothetical protein RU50_005328 [Salmonella enterica subsp. enterica]|nr:hypothetical protein [Salmonella enterica subsp. enterica]